MRVVERKMIDAIINGRNMKCGNTAVRVGGQYIFVLLHGNVIAEFCKTNPRAYAISDCGWQTVTTKSRLNAILQQFGGGRISQTNWKWYINNNQWHGSHYVEVYGD